MTAKIIGAVFILASCAGIGYSMVLSHRKKERMLQQLMQVIRFMISELQYRQTPLPELMGLASRETGGAISRLLTDFSDELELQLTPDAACCMAAVVEKAPKLPEMIKEKLQLLGRGLGRFDLSGQIAGLEAVFQLCKRDLDGLFVNRDAKLRSYLTLGICAGIALVILFA